MGGNWKTVLLTGIGLGIGTAFGTMIGGLILSKLNKVSAS